jgi:ribosomal protein L37AE/L43A
MPATHKFETHTFPADGAPCPSCTGDNHIMSAETNWECRCCGYKVNEQV